MTPKNAVDLHYVATLKEKFEEMACRRGFASFFTLCWWRIAADGQEMKAPQAEIAYHIQGVNLIRELLYICLNRDGEVHCSQTMRWYRQADPITCTEPNSPPSFSG